MIIELTGEGGVGKLTVGRVLARELGARLVDNHLLYDPAFATCEPHSPAFYATLRHLRDLLLDNLSQRPAHEPAILTHTDSDAHPFHKEWQSAVKACALARGSQLHVVHLRCSLEEQKRRIASPERGLRHKMNDPSRLDGTQVSNRYVDHADRLLEIDTTNLSAQQTAQAIRDWIDRLED